MSPVVELNVGGVLFQAYRKTFESSVHLKTLLGSDLDDDSVDASGRLFIDRDPQLFQQVLKLLRGYRFRSHPGLCWEEVKAEADFYQVPELESLAPEPQVVVVVPQETVVARRITVTRFKEKRTKAMHYTISRSEELELPADLACKVYTCAPWPHSGPVCLDIETITSAGFRLKPLADGESIDNQFKWTYECREKVVHYAKNPGTVLQVPEFPNEVLREDCPHWIRITCRFKVEE